MLKCDVCKKLWRMKEMIWDGLGYVCLPCIERENMETKNLEITVKLNGKIVPLDTISTETFEAIKTLEKPKEIPVARLADYYTEPKRLLLRPGTNIKLKIGRIYSFSLGDGAKVAEWNLQEDKYHINRTYKNIKPL